MIETKRRILAGKIDYDSAPEISQGARDVIDGLLKTNPAARIPLNYLLTYPWIALA